MIYLMITFSARKSGQPEALITRGGTGSTFADAYLRLEREARRVTSPGSLLIPVWHKEMTVEEAQPIINHYRGISNDEIAEGEEI